MGDDLYTDWQAVTEQDVQAAETADLIPTGTYEGQVEEVKVKIVDKETSPYLGERMGRFTVQLFDVEGKPRKHFFSATPAQRSNDNGIMGPSKLAAQLAKATGTVGRPFGETIEAAKATRLRYRVRLAPAKGQYEASNWTDAITAA